MTRTSRLAGKQTRSSRTSERASRRMRHERRLTLRFREGVGADDGTNIVVIFGVLHENGFNLLGQRTFGKPFLLLVRKHREHERLVVLKQLRYPQMVRAFTLSHFRSPYISE